MTILDFFKFHFNLKYRVKIWTEELSFVQKNINIISKDIKYEGRVIQKIHEEAFDRGSPNEQERHTFRVEEYKRDKRLLEKYIEREKFLKEKLGLITVET